MKKLFSVMLVVLALCGIASAVDIYITDVTGANDITIAPSDYITLLIWYTGVSEFEGGGGIQMFDLEATATGPGTILGGAITAGNRMSAYDAILMPGRMGGDIEVAGGRDDSGAVLLGHDPNGLATIEFHCEDWGLVTIALSDVMTFDQLWNQIAPTYHGMTIHQIPEPATIALLCLGSLLLRKKK